MRIISFLIIWFNCITLSSCEGCSIIRINSNNSVIEQDKLSYNELGTVRGQKLYINKNVDLKGKICELPKDITICFNKGSIENGTLVGNNNKVKFADGVLDNVKIKGNWNVPIIKTTFFKNLSSVNSLKDVLAFTNSNVHNKVYISSGEYWVEAKKEWDICLPVNSNTDIFIQGVIKLKPNNYSGCNVILATGNNINISGNGKVIGDRDTHTGNGGEWGFGINILNAKKVKIKGLTIENCWGDCIYIGGKSKDVQISNCFLSGSRRQGISITSANGVKISDCQISKISGTAPEYAIDVEPDPGESCDNIVVSRVDVIDCKGGFMVYGRVPNTRTGSIKIYKCKVSHASKSAFRFIDCKSATIDSCIITESSDVETVYFDRVKKISKKKIIVKK